MRPIFALGVLVVSIGSTARADVVCHAVNTPLVSTNWNTTISIPRFDPSLGTLNLVDVCVTSQMTGSCGVETLDSFPASATLQPAVQVSLYRPDLSPIASAVAVQVFTLNLSAFDGTIDFGGTSGFLATGLSVLTTMQLDLTSVTDLALFTGNSGSPGSVVLPISGQNVSIATGSGHLITQFILQGSGIVSICYDYTPVAAPFCAGDGTNTPCPCGNDSAVGAGQGCLNSFGQGAALRGSGFASIASDSLVLTCSNLHGAATGLFFQGTSRAGGGAGIAFGDGVRCVLGTNVRLGTKTASGGTAGYPEAGDAPISVRGSVPASSTRYYQFWYRNVASFCTAAPFNLSQGVEVHWTP